MSITTFETSEVGDRVWSITKGWGEINRIDKRSEYPLYVKYDSTGYDTFTFGGYLLASYVMRSLFWDEVKIEAPHKPAPDLEVDTKVLVWNNPNRKHRRHFSHFSNGQIYAFDLRSTSFTRLNEGSVTGWDYWELAE